MAGAKSLQELDARVAAEKAAHAAEVAAGAKSQAEIARMLGADIGDAPTQTEHAAVVQCDAESPAATIRHADALLGRRAPAAAKPSIALHTLGAQADGTFVAIGAEMPL